MIALYLAGKPRVAMVRALLHLNVNKFFVSRTISRYVILAVLHRIQKVCKKKTVTTPEMIRMTDQI